MSVSPGTVSGKVSFCMVCIAFKALRALNHLGTKKNYPHITKSELGSKGKPKRLFSKYKLAIAFVGDVDESVALRPLSLWQKVQFCQLSSQSPNI